MQEFVFETSTGKITPDDILYETNIAKRVLVINQDVDSTLLENYMLFILNWNREDMNVPQKKRQKIKIYINSNGGDSFIAGQFCSLIKSSTTPIIGVAFGLVASAAYHIYISCHERYAFENSILLQHDGEVEVANTPSKARDTMDFLDLHEERCKQNILENTNIEEDFYNDVYQTEFWMYADKAQELGVVDKIIGIDCKLDEIL